MEDEEGKINNNIIYCMEKIKYTKSNEKKKQTQVLDKNRL